MRLLYLVSEDWYFSSHRLPLALAAKKAGYDVHVATRLSVYEERLKDLGFTVHSIGMNRSSRGVSDIFQLAELVWLYQRVRPDIAHHVAIKPVIYGTLAAMAVPKTVVVNALAGLGFLFTGEAGAKSAAGRLVRTLLPWCLRGRRRHVIVQNPTDAAFASDQGVSKGNLNLIRGSGVDVDMFSPTPEPDGVPVAAMVARLLMDKGVGELVEAARLLRARGVLLRIALVGAPDPDNPASVSQAQVDAWVREGIVEWWGHRDDIAQVWREAHIAVLPSYREGLPKSLLEAASSSRPLISTDVPGCRDVVRHKSNGLLVAPKMAKPLADALEALAMSKALRLEYGANARKDVLAHFAESHIVEQTLNVYSRALS